MKNLYHKKGFLQQFFGIIGEIIGTCGDIIIIFLRIVLALIWRFKRYLSLMTMFLFIIWGITNYFIPHTATAQSDMSQPFQETVVLKLPMNVHPDLNLRKTILSLVAIEFGEDQVNSFDNIVTHESGWDPHALNKSSGACGLFQNINCNYKSMDIADQIAWGFNYIKQRYGNPTSAWKFWNTPHLVNGKMVNYY